MKMYLPTKPSKLVQEINYHVDSFASCSERHLEAAGLWVQTPPPPLNIFGAIKRNISSA
jgi:hypothetical protein